MESMQQGLSVVLVLALLGGTLWWLRRKGVARFGLRAVQSGRIRRLRSLERLALTPQHSLHLVQVEGRTLLIATSPGGSAILENAACLPAEESSGAA